MKLKKHSLEVADSHGVQGPARLVPGHLVKIKKHSLEVADRHHGVQGPARMVPGHIVKLKNHSLEVADRHHGVQGPAGQVHIHADQAEGGHSGSGRRIDLRKKRKMT